MLDAKVAGGRERVALSVEIGTRDRPNFNE
jgi:hypothetical protein